MNNDSGEGLDGIEGTFVVRLNRPLPASVAVERLFSCAGLTMNARRTATADELFENLILLKKNKSLM